MLINQLIFSFIWNNFFIAIYNIIPHKEGEPDKGCNL